MFILVAAASSLQMFSLMIHGTYFDMSMKQHGRVREDGYTFRHIQDKEHANKIPVGWCGEWTPRGGLSNKEFDPYYVEAISHNYVPSCSSTSGNKGLNRLSGNVGQTYAPPSCILFCDPPLQGGDKGGFYRRDPPVLALDLMRLPAMGSKVTKSQILRNLTYSAPIDRNTGEKHYQLSTDGTIRPEMSIVMPTHNAEEALKLSLPALCRHTAGLWEIVLILDQCYDESLVVMRSILLDECLSPRSGLVRARLLSQPTAIFETSSDNLGFSLASNFHIRFASNRRDGPTHAYAEVQSDMVVVRSGWNFDLLRPMLSYGDIVAVSGRCGHLRRGGWGHGRCNTDFANFDVNAYEAHKDTVRILQTVNRGPLLFRADALESLGFLDEVNFHQGNDDHDFTRRAFNRGWAVGYKYGAVYAPVGLSPTGNITLRKKSPVEGRNQSHHFVLSRKQMEKERRDHRLECDFDGSRWGGGRSVRFGEIALPFSRAPVGYEGELRHLKQLPIPKFLGSEPGKIEKKGLPTQLVASFPPLPHLIMSNVVNAATGGSTQTNSP